MQKKGFTLFTALVSFILIVLTSLIVGNMVATASNTAAIVASLEEQTKMQAIADLARADALQVFNYYIRLKIENYFISPASSTYITENWISVKKTEWENIKDDFIKDYFEDPTTKKHPFAEVMASAIQIVLGRGDYPVRGYSVKLIHYGDPTFKQLREVIKEAVIKAATDQNFFTVVGCDDGDIQNCNGSFYINLDFGPDVINDADYEKLPQVRVENLATGRIIQEPVLPRGKISFYIPVRIFKALAIAKIINKNLEDVASNYADWGIGLCGSCYPTAQGLGISISGDFTNKLCFGDDRTEIIAVLPAKATFTIDNTNFENFNDLANYLRDKMRAKEEIGKIRGNVGNKINVYVESKTATAQTIKSIKAQHGFSLSEPKIDPIVGLVDSVKVNKVLF